MTNKAIYIPFPKDLYDDLVRHTSLDVPEMAEYQIFDFLERTIWDAGYFIDGAHAMVFAENYFPEVARDWRNQSYEEIRARAATSNPLVWKEVTIDHGSKVRMSYGGKEHYAKVSDGEIEDITGKYSPSEWASKVANGTTRNAWRDIWFKDLLATNWVPATVLRDEAQRAKEQEDEQFLEQL